MAVKVRCPKCSKVLNAPDAARGRAVKCPGCESKVPVPADEDDAAPAKAASKPAAKAKAKKTASDADFLSSLNLDAVEDEKIRICPKCGARLSEEDDECPECGVDTRTGQLTARERRRRARGGPDTSRFWSEVWSTPWEFITAYWGLPIRMAALLSTFAAIIAFSLFAIKQYCDPATSLPPALFWLFVAFFFYMGIPGMLLTIVQQIVVHGMEAREKEYEPKFDMFAALANGFKMIAWTYVLPLPILGPVYFFLSIGIVTSVGILTNPEMGESAKDGAKLALAASGFTWAVVYGLSLIPQILVSPIAIVHWTRPYVHKAWSLWDMLKLGLINFVPCIYLMLIWFVISIPAGGLSFGLTWVTENYLLRWLFEGAQWVSNMAGAGNQGFMYETILALMVLLGAFVASFPLWLCTTFPYVFMARAIGEFGYYFKNKLDLVNKIPKHTLAGFWPRYLAFLIDTLLTSLISLVIFGMLTAACSAYMWAFEMKPDDFRNSAIAYSLVSIFGLVGLGAHAYYWAGSESSAAQGTLGMRSIGLIVVDEQKRRITMSKGLARFVLRGLTGPLIFYLGFIFCGFTQKKQTLHDAMTKTLVVFEGD